MHFVKLKINIIRMALRKDNTQNLPTDWGLPPLPPEGENPLFHTF